MICYIYWKRLLKDAVPLFHIYIVIVFCICLIFVWFWNKHYYYYYYVVLFNKCINENIVVLNNEIVSFKESLKDPSKLKNNYISLDYRLWGFQWHMIYIGIKKLNFDVRASKWFWAEQKLPQTSKGAQNNPQAPKKWQILKE